MTQTTRYAYDALGRRVSKLDSFGATHYLWDGDLMVHSQRGSKEALFVFEPNSFVPLATVQGTKNDKQTYWYQCDQIGAPQELTDVQGNIVWAADYKVWGEAKVRQITLPQSYRTGTDDYSANDFTPKRGGTWKLAGSNSANSSSNSTASAANQFIQIEQPFRFQGQQFDEETGLHYNRFRYYDPVIGRFVSQDPIGLEGGVNNFIYAPNPLEWVDPFGLCWQDKFRKRAKEEVEKLRREFDSKHRAKYLKGLAGSPGAEKAFSTTQLAAMRGGNAPIGQDGKLMTVHHKVPLFRGGKNDPSNFDLITATEHQKRTKELHYYDEGKNPYGCK